MLKIHAKKDLMVKFDRKHGVGASITLVHMVNRKKVSYIAKYFDISPVTVYGWIKKLTGHSIKKGVRHPRANSFSDLVKITWS